MAKCPFKFRLGRIPILGSCSVCCCATCFTVPGQLVKRHGWKTLTACVCQFILLSLDLVLQPFCFSSRSRDFGLHLLAGHVGRHRVGCTFYARIVIAMGVWVRSQCRTVKKRLAPQKPNRMFQARLPRKRARPIVTVWTGAGTAQERYSVKEADTSLQRCVRSLRPSSMCKLGIQDVGLCACCGTEVT